MNVMGAVVMEKVMDNSIMQINFNSNLKAGLYMVRLMDESGRDRGGQMICIE
jgi:hypothetical protein